MYPAERQSAIVAAAHEHDGMLSVTSLSTELEVTTETIRRDLAALERQGIIVRTHGGARLAHGMPFEISLAKRQAEEADEKRRIALRAIEELPSDGVVLLDSGSLALVTASVFPDASIIVVTNNLPAIPVLKQRPNVTVMALPGRVRTISQGAVDEWTRQRLSTLNVDLVLLGSNGLTASAGVTTTIPDEAEVKRAMLLSAKRRVLTITASKVGLTSFCHVADLAELDTIITDSRIERDTADELHAGGPDIVVV
ncbi:DeoR/GlpR family DNA-binding transcription regulator [Paramicrobacterium fandaimingii]|uniref:DeoR/GlpR family DNA-binding transcription regulator n=1 Tax=Paramicrobacterium fandaimingii TaxID=2708079 RepID=UPI001423EA96|nr:DeoR/GlpR family DNA-binding transcription regulator [Microbacterium fandaimingii]